MSDDGFRQYLCEYRYKGHTWSFTLMAESFEDAQARMKAMPFGGVLGEVSLHVSAPNWLARLFGVRA